MHDALAISIDYLFGSILPVPFTAWVIVLLWLTVVSPAIARRWPSPAE